MSDMESDPEAMARSDVPNTPDMVSQVILVSMV